MSSVVSGFTNDNLEDYLNGQDRDGLLRATRRVLADFQALSTRIAAVQEISTLINRSLNIDEILQVVGRQAKWLLDFDHCSACLCDRDGNRTLIPLFGLPLNELDTTYLNVVMWALQSKQPQLIQHNVTPGQVAAYRSQIVVLLESEDEILGAINFLRQAHNYTQDDVRIAYLLALQMASAIRNARRFEEINQLYSELKRTHAQLQQAQGLRDELTHMIVHDLRNPLSAINVGLDMIDAMIDDPDEQERWLEIASTASEQMTGMIDDLLNLNKMEAGKLQLALIPTNIGKLLSLKGEGYRLQAQAEAKDLVTHIAPNLPFVMVDGGLVSRVVDNLVSNAFKYTDAGGRIELGVSQKECCLSIFVRDNGLGIPPEYSDRIFDKFVQVTDPTGASLRKGTGLGLAFCRMAIEAHGGKIWVEPASTQGSTFVFTLPLEPVVLTQQSQVSKDIDRISDIRYLK